VLSCHGSEVLVRPATPRALDLPLIFPHFDRVMCVADGVRRAAESHGAPAAAIRVVPSAVDPNVFSPPARPPAPDGRFVVITVAILRWIKGYEDALLTIAKLREDGVPAVYEIVGREPGRGHEPPELTRLITTAFDLGIDQHIRLRGWLPEPAVVEALQQADAYLQSSLSEGSPTAVLEAMSCGLPVVATDVGGTREVITHGVEGLLVPPRDPRAAAEALAALWRDPARREEMGRAGRARVQAEFTLEQQLDRFEALYDEVRA
jgi:glycosyltransferase involved in cell wall biosynthesis